MLPEGGCDITDQIIVNMEYNGYLCHGNFRMLISQSPNSLKSQRSHAYSWWDFSFYPGLSFCCCFFQIWHWIKWEVNMWCHNDQRSFWIEKKIIKQFINELAVLPILKFTGWKGNETDTIHFLLLRPPKSLVRWLFMMVSSKGGYFIVSPYIPNPIML